MRLYALGAGPEEFFDPQMLLHRLEEKFDFPAAFVEIADGLGGEIKPVGQKHEPAARVRVAVADTPELAPVLRTFLGFEADRLVGPKASCPVMVMALHDRELTVSFHPGDEPDAALIEIVEPGVIDVRFVENGGRARLKVNVLARRAQIVVLAVGDDGELREIARDIDRGMQLYRAFCPAEDRPGRKREAELDRRRVEREHLAVKAKSGFLGSHGLGPRQASRIKLLQNRRRPCPVSIRKRAAANGSKPQPFRLAILVGKDALNSADRVVSGHLAEEQSAEPGPAIQGSHAFVAVVPRDELLELGARNQLDELGKYGRNGHGSGTSGIGKTLSQTLSNPRFQAFSIFTLSSEPDSSEVGSKFKAVLPWVGSGEVSGEATFGKEQSTKSKREVIEFNLALPQDVSELLKKVKSKKIVILENFHYLNDEVQRTLAFDLRTFQELGVKFVILGVWREKNRLMQFNGDLLDRIIEVPVEPWQRQEFEAVLAKGTDELRITFSSQLTNELIDNGFDSIGVVQELAKWVCHAAGVLDRQEIPREISDLSFLASAKNKKADDYGARHLKALEDIAEGRKTAKATEKSTPLYLPYYTVKAFLTFDFDHIVRGVRREELEAEIKKTHHRQKDVRANDMSNLLHNFAQLQSEKKIVPPIFDYDQAGRTMRVVDSTFYFFLRNSNREDVLASIENPLERIAWAKKELESN